MSLSNTKVSSQSDEFRYTEQILRIQLDSPTVTISEMYNVCLKPISVQFDRFVKSKDNPNVVDIFIPVSELQQPKNEILGQGLKVHSINGFTFTAEKVNISAEEPNCEVLHLKVALGNVMNYQDIKAPVGQVRYLQNKPTVSNLLDGYDSLRIGDNKFVVFHQSQVIAMHICKFVFDKSVDHVKPAADICSVCGKAGACVYCYSDDKKFCKECDEAYHSNQMMKDHKRDTLNKAMVSVQKCPMHPNCNVMYYCNKCHLPICMECKVRGSHAHGEFAKHKLVPIEKAYQDTMNTLRRPNPVFVEREKALNKAIEECKEKIKDIRMNQKSIEDEIMRVAMKAIEDARIQNAKTASKVKSLEEELIRKRNFLMKQEELLMDYKENSEPIEVLEASHRNRCIEKMFKDNKDILHPEQNGGDLILYGKLEVSSPKDRINEFDDNKVKSRDISRSTYSYTTEETASTVLEPRDPHFTKLTKLANRKQAKYDAKGLKVNFEPFERSKIVVGPELRNRLYMCFPFKGVPEPHLLFSTEEHGKSIRMMHKLIDNMGITCVLVKSRDQIFGGFAASKWDSNGVPKKQKSSTFLFQINKDAYIPYGGQSEDPIYMVATHNTLSFGGADLVLAGESFNECSSEIENSFGIGFLYGSQKAKEFLAGRNKFSADIVEVWGFFAD